MVSPEMKEIARRGQEIYDHKLRAQLEATQLGRFVAIEPESGDYFIAQKLDEAIQAARAKHPDRLAYALRVGFATAVELGHCPS